MSRQQLPCLACRSSGNACGQFMTMLQFEAGEIKRISYGDRVTH